MKEIKFRAWDKKIERYQYATINGKTMDLDLLCDLHTYKEDFILEQHTSLKDKNGKEIYEGDICKWHTTEAEWNPIWDIKWDDSQACFSHGQRIIANVFDSGYYQPCHGRKPYPGEGLEVIGNIHEHKHLLDKKVRNHVKTRG